MGKGNDENRGRTGLLSVLSVPALRPKAEKKSVGAELVPAGTLYSPGVLVGDTLYISGLQGTDPETHALPHDFGQGAERFRNGLCQRCLRADLPGRYCPVSGST